MKKLIMRKMERSRRIYLQIEKVTQRKIKWKVNKSNSKKKINQMNKMMMHKVSVQKINKQKAIVIMILNRNNHKTKVIMNK